MDGTFVILLALASQVDATVSFGIRFENRTGQRPVVVAQEEQVVSEFELVPSGALRLGFKRTTFNLGYSPRAYTRINLRDPGGESVRPLFLHSFNLGLTHAFTPRVRLTFAATGAVGEVDYGNVDLVQGRTQVVGGNVSAAGGLPQVDTFRSQDYGANLSLAWDVARRHTVTFGAAGNYNSSLGADPIFPDSYGGSGSLGWSWRFDPNYAFNLGTSYSESRVESQIGGLGEFRSIGANGAFDMRFSRLFSASIGAGVLVAQNRPALTPEQLMVIMAVNTGWSAIPTGNFSFTFIPTSGRGTYHVTTTLGAGIEGFVDPLQQSQGYVPRLALTWSLNLRFYEDWSFTPNASLFAPLSEPAVGQVNSLNETLVSFSVPLSYRISDELGIAAGVRVSLRGDHLRDPDFQFTDRFVLGFLSFTADVATRL